MDAPLHQIFSNVMVAEAMLPELLEDQRLVARGKRWLKGVAGRQTLGVSNTTGGSTSLHDLWQPVRVVGAQARAANHKPEAVEMVVPMLGGGFGRRLEADFVFQAVAIAAQAAGRPVQMIWTREQGFQHDFYRPAATARLRAAIDSRAKVVALDQKVASESVGQAQDGRNEPGKLAPARPPSVGGLAYAIPHQCYRQVQVNSAVPIGSWRSVDASYNGFFVESFIDEGRQDPTRSCRLAP